MLWECVDCGTQYSVDAPRCPHCGTADYRIVGDESRTVHQRGDEVTAPAVEGDGSEVPAP